MQIKHLARFIIVYAIFNGCATLSHPDRKVSSYLAGTDEEQLVDAINDYRESLQLPRLARNSVLNKAAQYHVNYVAKKLVLTHDEPEDVANNTPMKRTDANGGHFDTVAEIIECAPKSDPETIVKAWKESPEHDRKLRLQEVEMIGVAYKQITGDKPCDYIWVVDFGGNSLK